MKRFFLLTIILTVVVTGKVGAQEAASASKRANQQYVLFESERDKGTNVTAMYDYLMDSYENFMKVVEGTITIGCGEFAAVETLAKICKTYKEKYSLVQIVLHTATADAVYEMMNKGLVDIALFMEPVDTEGLDYIRITDCDHWCVGMRPDDPLAEKEFIKKEDLIGKPLILPERMNVQSELANWFGKDFSKLQIAFTSNLGTNAGVMAANGLGYPISIEGAAKYWREDILVQRRISPEITTSTVIAWPTGGSCWNRQRIRSGKRPVWDVQQKKRSSPVWGAGSGSPSGLSRPL